MIPFPKQNMMAEQLLDMIQPFVASKVEGDICVRIQEEFGELFQRGHQDSQYTAGLLLDDKADGSPQRILSLIVRMAKYQVVREGDRFVQRLDVDLSESQRDADILILGWPSLRTPETYWTIFPRKYLEYIPLRVSDPYFGGIEEPMPPQFSPFTHSIPECLAEIRKTYDRIKQNGHE